MKHLITAILILTAMPVLAYDGEVVVSFNRELPDKTVEFQRVFEDKDSFEMWLQDRLETKGCDPYLTDMKIQFTRRTPPSGADGKPHSSRASCNWAPGHPATPRKKRCLTRPGNPSRPLTAPALASPASTACCTARARSKPPAQRSPMLLAVSSNISREVRHPTSTSATPGSITACTPQRHSC